MTLPRQVLRCPAYEALPDLVVCKFALLRSVLDASPNGCWSANPKARHIRVLEATGFISTTGGLNDTSRGAQRATYRFTDLPWIDPIDGRVHAPTNRFWAFKSEREARQAIEQIRNRPHKTKGIPIAMIERRKVPQPQIS